MFDKKILPNGYIVDTRITWIIVILLISYVMLVLALYGDMDKTYIKCETEKPYCFNPLYDVGASEYPFNSMTVPRGYEYGEPVPVLVEYWTLYYIVVIVFGFTLNHYFYNRGFKFEN